MLAKGSIAVLEVLGLVAGVDDGLKGLDALGKDGSSVFLTLRMLLKLPKAKGIDDQIFLGHGGCFGAKGADGCRRKDGSLNGEEARCQSHGGFGEVVVADRTMSTWQFHLQNQFSIRWERFLERSAFLPYEGWTIFLGEVLQLGLLLQLNVVA